jgi:hypothetical protein
MAKSVTAAESACFSHITDSANTFSVVSDHRRMEIWMNGKQRQKKTLDRRLRDLEDHLHLLEKALAGLVGGDDADLKSLAAELRVLVCDARPEGLLWRILEELRFDDRVHVHLVGDLDRDNPLTQGLQFVYCPVMNAGEGPPQVPAGHYSLKGIIKKSEAIVISGTAYTHENLIRAVAEQMGTAHEDEGVHPYLVELSGTVMGDQPALHRILIADARLVLEIGGKAIARAVKERSFVKRNRPPIPMPNRVRKPETVDRTGDFEGPPIGASPEGTVMLVVDHPDHDWKTNSRTYDFGPFLQRGLSVHAVKHPDRSIEVHVQGLAESAVTTRRPMPASGAHGNAVLVITWDRMDVKFYVSGGHIDTITYCAK